MLIVSDNPYALMATGSTPVVRKVQQQENFLFAEYSVTSRVRRARVANSTSVVPFFRVMK